VTEDRRVPRGSPAEVFGAFLKLGLTSFGGPVAHLGYFRNELVLRRRWIDEAGFGDLVALCQFLPGPASSQLGFALGLVRAGALGALAAWTAFTVPSALLMVAFAYGADLLSAPWGLGLLHGLKIVAVAVVAQAVYGMAISLAPDRTRAAIAAGAVVLVVALGTTGQVAAIALGGLAGLAFCQADAGGDRVRLAVSVPRVAAIACLAICAALLVGLPLLRDGAASGVVAVADAFYRSGALVFGGGHVVLPMLQAEVVRPGWVSDASFLAGYGAAQALPGPLFTFAAYLGAAMRVPPGGVVGAGAALLAIFLPGLLLVTGVLPFWDRLRRHAKALAAMRGANASVVGILAAALYDPVWTSAILAPRDFAAALVGFVLLTVWRVPPLAVVALGAIAGMLMAA